ncbi:MAG: hypothetical protein LV471_04890 [Nitrosomonas sp.]|nr:hypothetical protein [Nitrosomonas sp.]
MPNPPESDLVTPAKRQYFIGACIIIVFIAIGIFLGTSSQGDFSDTYPKGFRGSTCTIEAETMTIGYSSYYLPDEYTISDDEPRTPYIPVQCDRIPEPGMLNITIDLLYPESSRDFLLALRLVKLTESGTTEGNAGDIEVYEEQDILLVPEQTYQSGVITQALRLDETGQYRLYLDGRDENGTRYQVKIPIKVGTEWKDKLRNFLPPFFRKFI